MLPPSPSPSSIYGNVLVQNPQSRIHNKHSQINEISFGSLADKKQDTVNKIAYKDHNINAGIIYNSKDKAIANIAVDSQNVPPDQQLQKASKEHNGSVQYKNAILGISLRYPSTWSKVEELDKNQIIFFSPKEDPLDRYQENLRISVQYFKNLDSSLLDELVKETINQYEQNLTCYCITVNAITAFGFKGYTDETVHYKYRDSFDKEVRQTFFLSNDKFYSIAYTADAFFDKYAHFLPTIEKMLDSIEILNSNSSVVAPPQNSAVQHIASLTSPINLSKSADEQAQNEKPQIAVSKNGSVYVVWEKFDRQQVLFSRSTDGGASFGKSLNITNENEGNEPQIAVSGNNNAYVMWNNLNQIGFIKSTDGGASFSNETTFGNEKNLSDIDDGRVAAFGNNVYIVLFNTFSEPHRIYFIKSTDGGASFSSPIILSKNETGDVEEFPWLALSGNGTIYVAWSDGNDNNNNDVVFSRSTDGGTSFSSPIRLFEKYSCTSNLKMISSESNVYAICMQKGEDVIRGNIPGTKAVLDYNIIIFTASTDWGTSFSSPVKISEQYSEHTDFPDISASGDNVYITWQDNSALRPGGTDIYFRKSTNRGVNFGNIIDISYDVQDSVHPKIDVFGNNTYIVWDKVIVANSTADLKYDHIFLTTSTDGGASFSNATNISTNNLNYSDHILYPSIKVQNDSAYVIWVNGMEGHATDILFVKIAFSDQDNDNTLGLPSASSQQRLKNKVL